MRDPRRDAVRMLLGSLNGTMRPGLRLTSLKTLRETPREASEAAIRRLCAAVPMADGMTLCRALGRYKMFVDSADFGLSPNLMLDGYWEMWVTEAILETVRPGMVTVDVGANLGYYTLLMADIVGPGGHVHACEPNPRMLDLLGRSVALNGYSERVSRHASPLAATSGEPVRLLVPRDDPKNAHLTTLPADADPSGMVAHALHSATLDDIVGDGIADFVKIDAEGSEREIWRGMRHLLARGRPLTVFMEFAADRYADPGAFVAEFAVAGFSLARIDHRDGVVTVSAEDILRARHEIDQMLVLRR